MIEVFKFFKLIPIIRKVKNYFISKLAVHPTASVIVNKSASIKGTIKVGKKSSLTIEEDVIINGDIIIGENCKVIIHKKCVINNYHFNITNHSVVEIGEGCVFGIKGQETPYVNVDNGTFQLAEKAIILANISVRFGGQLLIGKHCGISYGSEIRCEDLIKIGEYVRISYEVCIYDSNTHSTDWKKRRERIEIGYPHGIWEETKPDTKPIRIGNDVWIGKGATVLKGCIIGNRSIVGIRTVVSNKKILDDCIVVTADPRIILKK